MTATIRAEHVLPHAPARVWRALTDPEQLGKWLMPTTFRPEKGARFTFDTRGWGDVHGEVLDLEPERLLRISWKNPPLDTTVTWTLSPEGAGTRLVLEHAGFDLDDPRQKRAYDGMRAGWTGNIPERLAQLLG